MNAVRAIRKELDQRIPLIGFSGSPWTLATYMVEGRPSKAFTKIKKLAFSEPDILNLLLEKVTESVIQYLNAQIKAGAEAIMIFDTWGGVLSKRDYIEFSLTYMKQIVSQLNRVNGSEYVPVTLFTKNGGAWLEDIANTGCDAIGVDWTTNIKTARDRVGSKVAIQGNMDPSMLYASPQRIEQEVKCILDTYGNGTGHIFNLGHGIHPDAPPEDAKSFIDAVHKLSAEYHQ